MKTESKILPDFLVIGAMKAGTTSLYRYLAAHPDIQLPADKELDFFVTEKNFAKGPTWYSSHFARLPPSVRAGECSPNYSKHPMFAGVPDRIHALLPDVRLIYLVREPVERTLSHYYHNWLKGSETRSLVDALALRSPENKYLAASCYWFQLERFLEYFPERQILVLRSEDLQADRLAAVNRVYRFLGLEPAADSTALETELHRSAERRRLNPLGRLLADSVLIRRIASGLPSGLARRLKSVLGSKVQTSAPPPGLRDDLRAFFQSDTQSLEAFANRDAPLWP